MRDLPRGTVTFLFTDIEGSTRTLKTARSRAICGLARSASSMLRETAARHGGVEVDTQGDSFFLAFPYARDAVLAAADGQLALARHDWDGRPVKVRMGLHSGEPTISTAPTPVSTFHRAASGDGRRHGGQVSLSARTPTSFRTSFRIDRPAQARRLSAQGLRRRRAFEPAHDRGPSRAVCRRTRGEEATPRGCLVPRSVRKHPWVAAAGIVVVAAAAAGVAVLLQTPAPKLQADALAELNARTGKILGSVPVGTRRRPSRRRANHCGSRTLLRRLSPASILRRHELCAPSRPGYSVGVAVGGGSIWVVNSDLAAAHSTITRIDERYQRATATIALRRRS